MILEVCANSVQSAINAELGGAKRIELCQNLNEGGTTPSFGSISFCVNNLKLSTFVLIRPRTGNFCYSDADFDVIKRDIDMCKQIGVSGVVVGCLRKDLSVDTSKMSQIVQLASPMEVTFHRAFDISPNWSENLEAIIQCGCHRLLTSGLKKNAIDGIPILKKLFNQAGERIIIMPGSGINAQNIDFLLRETGAKEVHASCKILRGVSNDFDESLSLDKSNVEYMETSEIFVRDTIR